MKNITFTADDIAQNADTSTSTGAIAYTADVAGIVMADQPGLDDGALAHLLELD